MPEHAVQPGTEAAELDAQRQEAEEAAAQLAAAQTALEQQEAQLNDMQDQLSQALQQADDTQTQEKADLQAKQQLSDMALRKLDEAEKQLDAYVASQNKQYTTPSIHCSLDFRCPLDSYSSITTQFANSDPWGRNHNGTDFAAAGGTPHLRGGGRRGERGHQPLQLRQLCADQPRHRRRRQHLRHPVRPHAQLCGQRGQTVKKGDLIGYVGNTGEVYGKYGGYHLHLELRVNNVRTNPLSYIPH